MNDLIRTMRMLWEAEPSGGGAIEMDEPPEPMDLDEPVEPLEAAEPEPASDDIPPPEVEPDADPDPEPIHPPERMQRLFDLMAGRAPAQSPQQQMPPQAQQQGQQMPPGMQPQGQQQAPPELPPEHLWDTNPREAMLQYDRYRDYKDQQLAEQRHAQMMAQQQRQYAVDAMVRMEHASREHAYGRKGVLSSSDRYRQDEELRAMVDATIEQQLIRAATFAERGEYTPASELLTRQKYDEILSFCEWALDRHRGTNRSNPPIRPRGAERAPATGAPKSKTGISPEIEKARKEANEAWGKFGVNISQKDLHDSMARIEELKRNL